jgi:hypothetical protein
MASPAGEISGCYVIPMQHYDRYRVPVMHTATNHPGRPMDVTAGALFDATGDAAHDVARTDTGAGATAS